MKRLATSVVLNKFDPSLYSLHRSAISHKKGCAQSQEDALNKGGSEVVDVPCDGASRDDTITESTTIDNLLQSYSSMRQNVVVKMDIQGYEPYGLLGAESLFTTHNVTMLYMEWAEMKKSLNGEHKVLSTPEYQQLAERTVGKLVLERGYSVYSMDTGNILKWENRKQWANNVFLIHADVKHRFSTTKSFPQPLNSI
ncbi:uncharacterized protein LOC134848335 [Symsagittifera roscoffensis]|uniref:uncharacterized protein LOC134848335 n=1 Tax=Symsagittifera roscoffensis TaxID=84072 RepID=UPI00307B4E5A